MYARYTMHTSYTVHNHFSAMNPCMASWIGSALSDPLSSLGAASATLTAIQAASIAAPYPCHIRKLPGPISSFPSSAPPFPQSNPHT